MKRLSASQRNRASEISGNISVAWFSAGIISPIIAQPRNIFDFFLTFGVSLVMAGFFLGFSLDLVKGVKL